MEVYSPGHHVLFHHLSPETWEPLEFPSYGSGFVQAPVLQEDVCKMLSKGALEMVDHPSPGFLQSPASSPEGDRCLASSYQTVSLERIHHLDGDGVVGIRVYSS